MNTAAPNAGFIQSIGAGLCYWQERVSRCNDATINELELERHNLHHAVQYGLVLPDTWRDAAVLMLQSFNFVERNGYWPDWIPLYKKASINCPDHELSLNVKIAGKLGQLYRLAQQLPEAITIHEEALETAVKLQDNQLLAEVHFDLGEDYRVHREYIAAERHASTALSIFAAAPQMEHWQAAVLNTLGLIARARRDLPLSEQQLSQAVTIRRSLKQSLRLARSLNDLAITLQEAQKFDRARQILDEALTILTPSKNTLDKVRILNNLGTLYFKQQQWIDAETTFRKAISILATQTEYIYYRAVINHNLGEVLYKQSRLIEAEEFLRNSIGYWEYIADTLMLANTVGILGEVLAEQGQMTAAKSTFEQGIRLLEEQQNNVWAGQLLKKYRMYLNTLTVN